MVATQRAIVDNYDVGLDVLDCRAAKVSAKRSDALRSKRQTDGRSATGLAPCRVRTYRRRRQLHDVDPWREPQPGKSRRASHDQRRVTLLGHKLLGDSERKPEVPQSQHLIAKEDSAHGCASLVCLTGAALASRAMESAPPIALMSGKDVLHGVGGHETYVRAHAMAAKRLGLDPHVFCVGPRSRTTITDYATVHHVRAPGPVAAQGPPLAYAAAALATSEHVLGIHGFALWASAGVLAGRIVARRGFRSAVLCNAYGTRAYEVAAMQEGLQAHHGKMNRLRYKAWLSWIQTVDDPLERWGYKNSEQVLVNYTSTKTILRDAYSNDLNIRLAPYATTSAFEDYERASAPSNGPAQILCVSRHDPRKGVDVLIEALRQIASEGIPFQAELVGPGRLLDTHRQITRKLGIDSLVNLPGRVEDVRPLYAAADIFVLPSLAEASGSVSVLEALRAGTAIIATDIDGLPEDLTDHKDSLLVDPANADALATALKELLKDPVLRRTLAEGARNTHNQRFSATSFTAELGIIYGDLGILQNPVE